MAYCTPTDLIRYGNTARLLSQLAGRDFGTIPTAEEVLAYFTDGTSTAETEQNLQSIKSRVTQAIDNSSGEINGYLAMFTAMNLEITFPADTLTTANMDLALYRLFDDLPETSVILANANKWTTLFDNIATGKISTNSNKVTSDDDSHQSAPAETTGSDMVWTMEALDGY